MANFPPHPSPPTVTRMSVTALLTVMVLLESSVNAEEVNMDDSSASISYSSGWQDVYAKASDPPEWGSYYGGSTHASSLQDSSAKVSFNGTAVTYYGDTDMGHGVAQVALDGDTVGEQVNSTTEAYVRGVALWKRTGLVNISHTLVITHAGPQGSWITLDQIQYTFDDPPVVVTTTATTTAATSSSSTTSSSSSPTAPSQTALTTGISSEAIVAKAVAITLGICLILFILLLLLWRWRRQSKKKRRSALFSETATSAPSPHTRPKDPPQYQDPTGIGHPISPI